MDNRKKTYTIVVSEPWDFESQDGKNIIKGTILSIVSSHLLVFKANYTLNFNSISGDILILSPRHNTGDFYNVETKEVDVNGGILLVDYNKLSEETSLKDNCRFTLIGTLGI